MRIIQKGHNQGGEPQDYELTILSAYIDPEDKELTIEVSEE